MRHFDQRFETFRSHFVSFLPFMALVNGLVFLVWSFFGEQYLLTMDVDVSKIDRQALLLPRYRNSSDLLITWLQSEHHQYHILRFSNNMGDFSPIITVKEIWEHGARLFPIGVTMSIGIFPYIRVLLWTWLWFIPTEEAVRGRLLTMLNILGKYTLGNFFLLNIVGMAEFFVRQVRIPIPFIGHIDITIRETFITGFGTNGVIYACVFGLLLGDAFLRVHGRAKVYEEELREALGNTTSNGRLLRQMDSPFDDWAVGEDVLDEPLRPEPLKIESKSLMASSFSPIPGKLHEYSYTGITVMISSFVAVIGFLTWTLFGETFSFHRSGLAQSILIPSAQKDANHAIIHFADDVKYASVDGRTRVVTVVFYLLCVVMPVCNLMAMIGAFCIPMGLSFRRFWFRIIETTQALSALDVLLLTLIVTWAELETISTSMCNLAMPFVSNLAEYIGFEHGLYTVAFEFPYFAVVLIFAIAERVLSHIVVHQFAALLSEDEMKLKIGVEDVSGAMPLFSPTQRYLSLSMVPSFFYAGTPRILWRFGIWLGLLQQKQTDSLTEPLMQLSESD